MVYLIHRHMPKTLKATDIMTFLLWLSAIVITAFAVVSEYRKFFLNLPF